jgi:hypothetical protein
MVHGQRHGGAAAPRAGGRVELFQQAHRRPAIKATDQVYLSVDASNRHLLGRLAQIRPFDPAAKIRIGRQGGLHRRHCQNNQDTQYGFDLRAE